MNDSNKTEQKNLWYIVSSSTLIQLFMAKTKKKHEKKASKKEKFRLRRAIS